MNTLSKFLLSIILIFSATITESTFAQDAKFLNEDFISAVSKCEIKDVKSTIGLSTTKSYSAMSADELKDALMKTIRENDVDSVSKILDQSEAKCFDKIILRKALELAAKNNFIKIVHMLIQVGADVKHEYSYALKDAAEKGYIDVVRALLPVQGTDKRDYSMSFYMDINPFNALRDEALIKAAKNGHIDVVEELIQAGADVNFMNNWGERALVIAAKNGHANVVKKLIQAGAKVNTSNKNGHTALNLAVMLNHVDVARELLQVQGIDVDWFAKNEAQRQGGEMQKLFKPDNSSLKCKKLT